MKKTIYIFLLLLISNQLLAQEQNEANTKIYDFVKQYEMFGGFSSNIGMSYNREYRTEFAKLFESPQKEIIVPSKEAGQISVDNQLFYTVNQYSLNVQKQFPNGFEHKIDILSIAKPKYVGSNAYWVDVEIVKYIYGLNNTKSIVREECAPLILKIYNSDVKRNNIKITKIYDPKKYVDMAGWHYGVVLSSGLSGFTTKEGVLDDTWSESRQISPINGGIEIVKYGDKPSMGFGFRIQSMIYGIKANHSNYIIEKPGLKDRDDDIYTYHFNTEDELTETMKAGFIEIPIFYKYRYEFIQNTKINHAYVNVGPSFGFNYSLSDSWDAKGTTKGDYSTSLGISDPLEEIPFYGFYKNIELELSEEAKIAAFNVSVYLEGGGNFVLSNEKKISCDIGIIYQRGLISIAEADAKSYVMSDKPENFSSTINSREDIKTSYLGIVVVLKKQR